MATLRHKKLAQNIRKYKTMEKAMVKSEYKPSYAKASTLCKKTKGFQEVVTPILDRYLKEEQRLMDAMEKKDLTQEQYKVLTDGVDKIRKQIQLLSGKPTERTETIFNDEQLKTIAGRILDGDKSGKDEVN